MSEREWERDVGCGGDVFVYLQTRINTFLFLLCFLFIRSTCKTTNNHSKKIFESIYAFFKWFQSLNRILLICACSIHGLEKTHQCIFFYQLELWLLKTWGRKKHTVFFYLLSFLSNSVTLVRYMGVGKNTNVIFFPVHYGHNAIQWNENASRMFPFQFKDLSNV